MTYFLSGLIEGIDRGRTQALDEIAAHWAHVAHIVHANGKLEPYTLGERIRRARQLEACQDYRTNARPWPPDEGPPLPKNREGYYIPKPKRWAS